MITKEQVQHAKVLFDQAHESTSHAHHAYAEVKQSEKSLKDAFREAGVKIPKEIAGTFENLITDHVEKYKAALDHLIKLEDEYKKLLEDFEEMST